MGNVCTKSGETEPPIERENSRAFRITTNIRTRSPS
jgi:hypothetical protein